MASGGSPGSVVLFFAEQPRVAVARSPTSTPGSALASSVERADVVAVGVGQRDPHDRAAELRGRGRGSPSRCRGSRCRRASARPPPRRAGVDEAGARDARGLTPSPAAPRTRCAGSAGTCRPGGRAELVARLDELRGVGRERRRVAGDVDDPLRRGLDDAAHDLLRQAGARRVDDDDVGLARLLDELAHRQAHVAGVEGGVGDLVERAFSIASATAASTSSSPIDARARAAASESAIVPMPQ